MAYKLIYIPTISDNKRFVRVRKIEYDFFPGFSVTQKQKCINSLHKNALKLDGINSILEVSTKSHEEIGKKLSAFNLTFISKIKKEEYTVESTFQGSKVFEYGGPFTDLYLRKSIEAKRDIRLKQSGKLLGFKFFNIECELYPKTAFYDWLYINSLYQKNDNFINKVINYDSFSDIEFNYKKSINCQAHSVALFCGLKKRNLLNINIANKDYYLKLTKEYYENYQLV